MAKKQKKKLPEIEVDLGADQLEGIEDIEDIDLDDLDFQDDAVEKEATVGVAVESIADMIKDVDKQPVHAKLLIYGEQGTGKTTFAGTAEGPILFVDCNERGTASIRGQGHKVINISDADQFESLYWYLASGEHPFKTVVIDTVSNMMDIAMQKVLDLDEWEGLPIRKHWGQLTQWGKTWFINYRNLPMHVIFLAQLRRIDEEDAGIDDDYTRVPMLSPAVRAALGAAVDCIGYTYIKSVVGKDKKGNERLAWSYRLRIGPSNTVLTKMRTAKGVKYKVALRNPEFKDIVAILKKGE